MNWYQKFLTWLGLYKGPTIPILIPKRDGLYPSTIPLPPNGQWSAAYDEIIKSKLTLAMLSYKNMYFNSPYSGSELQLWWPKFMQAICYVESGYDNNSVYVEKFIDDSTGEPCKSVGLFQLSVGDANSYPNCPTVVTLDNFNLTEPVVNIKAACEIMDYLISNGKPLSSYWSSCSPEHSGPQTLAKLKELLNA